MQTWIALDESHTVAYNAYHSDGPGELGKRLNVDVIPAHYYGQVRGDTYTFADYGAPQGEPVWYWLEEVTDEPATLLHGPVTPGGGPAMQQRTPETVYEDIYNSYYYLGGQRIALRRKSSTLPLDYLMYLLPDHLGTVRLETYGDGPNVGDMRASTPTTPYGGVRTVEPVSDHWFTGQYFDRSEDLYDYGARPYDPLLGLFIQPDSIVPNPGDPQALNRYAYVLNNPVKYRDPTGHAVCINAGCNLLESPANGSVIVRDVGNSTLYLLIALASMGSSTAANRLDMLLNDTAGLGKAPLPAIDRQLGLATRTHFQGLGAFRGDVGFAPQFRDDHHYTGDWGYSGPESRQTGHFLTAVDMGLARGWVHSIVGHEQSGDTGAGVLVQITRPTLQDKQAFMAAVAWDTTGAGDARDRNLSAILNPEVHGALANRQGNSLEDLRLSVRGWRLGYMTSAGRLGSNNDLANWIALNVAGD